MKKCLLVLCAMLVISMSSVVSLCHAQGSGSVGVARQKPLNDDAPNAIYLELGGNALAYSINYDRFVSQDASIRVGFEYWGINGAVSVDGPDGAPVSASLVVVPATLNYFLASHNGRTVGSSKLELGAGIVYMHLGVAFGGIKGAGDAIGGTATLGYRYQPYDGGFVFRAGVTPIFVFNIIQVWGGISAGVAF